MRSIGLYLSNNINFSEILPRQSCNIYPFAHFLRGSFSGQKRAKCGFDFSTYKLLIMSTMGKNVTW